MAFEWTQTAVVRKGGLVEVMVPSLEEGSTVEVLIREGAVEPRKPRVFGRAKGQGSMRNDFDAPLDDFKDYM